MIFSFVISIVSSIVINAIVAAAAVVINMVSIIAIISHPQELGV